MPKAIFYILLIVCLSSCGTVRLYPDADKPIYLSNEKSNPKSGENDSLHVLTYNIEESKKIDLAIKELKQFDTTGAIDIYLLQEMDETGVQKIAAVFNLNYLYIPIVHNNLIKKDIGNAILSKGTISHPEKLILPHAKWTNHRRRHIAIGEVTIRQKKILVYSVHTETVSMSRKHRQDQVQAIIRHANMQARHYNYILIGGDFNTLHSKDSWYDAEQFRQNGFDWATLKAGSTASAFFGLLKPTHDYIFSKGFKIINARKMENSKSSDHHPIMATFKF